MGRNDLPYEFNPVRNKTTYLNKWQDYQAFVRWHWDTYLNNWQDYQAFVRWHWDFQKLLRWHWLFKSETPHQNHKVISYWNYNNYSYFKRNNFEKETTNTLSAQKNEEFKSLKTVLLSSKLAYFLKNQISKRKSFQFYKWRS